MAKKNKKRDAMAEEMARHLMMYTENPFSNNEALQKYCEAIKEEAHGDCNDCSYTNFNERKLHLPLCVHQFANAVVMFSQTCADPFWIKVCEGDIVDIESYTGMITDPTTGLPKLRAFMRHKFEDTGEDCYSELESVYTVAQVNYSYTDKAHTVTGTYALVTGFINGAMFEYVFYEAPSISIIKEFISEISVALKANLEKRLADMPKKETFMELMSKLIVWEKCTPLPSLDDDNASEDVAKNRSHYNSFDRELKFATVKRIKENQLTIAEAAKEVGIHHSGIHNWIREFDKKGDKAFRGRGRVSPKTKKLEELINKLFPDEAIEAATSDYTTATDIDASECAALNLTPEEEKKLADCSYQTRKFKRQFKIEAVKLIKEYQLPVPQVAKKLGVYTSTVNRWIAAVKKHGEDAFPDPGPKSKPKLRNNQMTDVTVKPESSEAAMSCAISAYNKKKAGRTPKKKTEYDQGYKMAVVKYIDKNQLSPRRVAKELGISYTNVHKWIDLYEEHGENAFPGSGVYYEEIINKNEPQSVVANSDTESEFANSGDTPPIPINSDVAKMPTIVEVAS